MADEGAGPLLVLAHGDSWERRFQVSSLVASAAAAGQRVDLALFFAALACWAEERWDDPPPPSAPPAPATAPEGGGVPRTVTAERLGDLAFPPLTSLLAPAREGGLLRLHACSASVRLLGLPLERVQARVDTVSGWPTFHRLLGRAGRVVTF